MRTLYKAKWILPSGGVVIENGGMLIENGKILDVFYLEPPYIPDCEVIELGNAVITPGFINLHAHLQYTDVGKKQPKDLLNKLKRIAMKLRKLWIFKEISKSFTSWIVNLIIEYFCWSKEEKLESFNQGLNEVLRTGTTTIAQLSGEEMFFEVLNNNPIKAYIFLETYADSAQSVDKSFELFKNKYEKMVKASSASTFIGVSPHSIYNVHKDLWKKLSDYSREKGILIHTHFAESSEEIRWIKEGTSDISKLHNFIGCKHLKPETTGLSPVKYLKSLDLPHENLTLAHINQLSTQDYQELADLGISIAHCPRSNMILHNKTLNIVEALKAFQYRIGLGTDSLYSNNDINLLHEAKTLLNKNVDLLTILDMLTINAARILKLDHLTGGLHQGKDADFLIFKLEKNENYKDLINKDKPDCVYICGKELNNNPDCFH